MKTSKGIGDLIADKLSFRNFRQCFYAVTPSESTYPNLDSVPAMLNDSMWWFIVFISMEMLYLWRKKKFRDVYEMNNSLCSMGTGLVEHVVKIMLQTGGMSVYQWVYENYSVPLLPWDSAWTWFASFVAVDFCYYWFHRACHEVNILWAFHQGHHASEYYNLSNAVRLGIFEKPVSMFAYVPAAFLIPPQVFMTHLMLNTLYQFWLHTAVIGKVGAFGWIFNNPSHHRVHHGRNPYCIDKNYASVFVIWDRLFGTYQDELEEEPVAYGLVHNVNSVNVMYIQFYYFKEVLWNKPKSVKGFKNILKCMLFGPGWELGKPRTGDLADIPQIESPIKRYVPDVPYWVTAYVLGHGLTMAVALDYFGTNYASMSSYDYWWYASFILFSVTFGGVMLEMKWYTFYVELARLAVAYQKIHEDIWPINNFLSVIIHLGFIASALLCIRHICTDLSKENPEKSTCHIEDKKKPCHGRG